jgi:hypothetical protein
VAIDEPGEDGQAGGIDRLGITRRLNGRTSTRMCDPSAFYDNDRFARRLPGGGVEEAVSVDSPNHCPMLVRSEGVPPPGNAEHAFQTSKPQSSSCSRFRNQIWLLDRDSNPEPSHGGTQRGTP